MIIIDEILSAINSAMDLAQKKNDKEVAEKLVGIYSSVLELKKENEELRSKIADLEKSETLEEDLVLADGGFYYRQSEVDAGKRIRYCAACYNNTGKLHPITRGSMHIDYFCTNCRMHYTGWTL